jgi:predicted esterase
VVIERVIATGTHGRFLLEHPSSAGSAPLLVGFHGYGEDAGVQLERMRRIPGADRWRLVSVQGLHRFYQRRTNEVVASWMTRQDRELAIADNLAYVDQVLAAVDRENPGAPRLVFTGFSQGVAMMFRAAVAAHSVDAVIAVGGDVPPEIEPSVLTRVKRALVCHGERDEWYTADVFSRDVQRLRGAGVHVEPLDFPGGHEWSTEVVEAAATLLRERWP